MDSVLGFLDSPAGAIALGIIFGVLAPILALPLSGWLDGRAQPHPDRVINYNQAAKVSGNGSSITQTIDNSRHHHVATTSTDGDDWGYLLAAIAGVAAAVGLFLSIGPGPIVALTAATCGLLWGLALTTMLLRLDVKNALLRALLASLAVATSVTLQDAKVGDADWEQVSSRMHDVPIIERFFVLENDEATLVLSILFSALLLSLLSALTACTGVLSLVRPSLEARCGGWWLVSTGALVLAAATAFGPFTVLEHLVART